MSLVNQNFDMYAGDTKDIVVTVTGVDGITPVNLTGATIKWVAVRGKAVILNKQIGSGITITDAVNGKYQIRLDHIDTQNILGSLYHESVVTDVLGNVSTVMVGTIRILPSFI